MPERTWTYPSVSEPGVTRTVRLVDGVLVCDCPARHRCKHIDQAEADLGFDFTAPDPVSSDDRVEAPPPRLYTSTRWAWREEMGIPCRITIGSAPDDFPTEVDDGLRWCLAPFGRLFHLTGEEFEVAFRQHLDQIGVGRIQQSINQVARRHPGQDTLTLLCWESGLGEARLHMPSSCVRLVVAGADGRSDRRVASAPTVVNNPTPPPTSKGSNAIWSTQAAYRRSLAIPNHHARRRRTYELDPRHPPRPNCETHGSGGGSARPRQDGSQQRRPDAQHRRGGARCSLEPTRASNRSSLRRGAAESQADAGGFVRAGSGGRGSAAMTEDEAKRIADAAEALVRVAERIENELKRGGLVDRLITALEKGK